MKDALSPKYWRPAAENLPCSTCNSHRKPNHTKYIDQPKKGILHSRWTFHSLDLTQRTNCIKIDQPQRRTCTHMYSLGSPSLSPANGKTLTGSGSLVLFYEDDIFAVLLNVFIFLFGSLPIWRAKNNKSSSFWNWRRWCRNIEHVFF
jgi:hypothetical protein